MKTDSIALRLSGLFALVALLVFTLIGWALYLQVDKSMALLPEAEAEARYSVLESAVNRHSDVEHWGRIKNKLKLLSEEDKRLRFWVVSDNPVYEFGNPDADIRRFANGPLGMRELRITGHEYPFKVLVSQFEAREQRPPLRFLIAVDTDTFLQTQHSLMIALIGFATLGILLASVLGYWAARIGLRPLTSLSLEARKLTPPKLSGRLQMTPLPPELNQFVTSFNSTLERVEQAYARLESFNADVAHELRSPLTNLIGQTQVALTRGRSAEHYFEVLQSNLEELERLRSIINDMLFLASADQGSKVTELTCASLAEEVATTLDYLDFILEDAQVRVEVHGDARVPMEKAHLRRALINLLHNAVQHTEAGRTIRVDITEQKDHVSVGVANPGTQIASEHLPKLFERFYRVDASRANSGANHGLGLAIVKAIALMHGGSVFVHSREGINTFGINLPL